MTGKETYGLPILSEKNLMSNCQNVFEVHEERRKYEIQNPNLRIKEYDMSLTSRLE